VTLLDEVDRLYETSVMSPDSLGEQSLADWASDVASGFDVDREGAKYVRRCINVAKKLIVFWTERSELADGPAEWRARVDIAQGIRAWRPQLDLASHLLTESPSPELFGHTVALFRVVNNEPFLDGISYEEWLMRHN